MSRLSMSPVSTDPVPSVPIGRWAGLVVVLILELLGLTACFDSGALRQNGHWWGRLLGQSSQLLQIAVAGAIAGVVFRAPRLIQTLRARTDRPPGGDRWWVPLAGHLTAFAALIGLTVVLFGGDSRSLVRLSAASPLEAGGARATAWVLAWAGCGIVTIGLWLAALLPPRVWFVVSRVAAEAAGVGLAVGALGSLAGRLTSLLWEPLSIGTFRTVGAILRLLGQPVISEPAEFLIGTPTFQVTIAPECSGYEGIGLMWVFLVAYLGLCRESLRFPRTLILLPLGTVLIWIANSIRIAALILVGTHGSEAVAVGGFHSQAGWLLFNAVALGLIVVSYRTPWFRRDWVAQEPLGANPAAAYLGPMLALIGVMMLTTAVSAGLDRLYPARILAATLVLWVGRRQYVDLRWTVSWQAIAIGILVFAIWMALEPPLTEATPLRAWLRSLSPAAAAAWILVRVLGSSVIVPIAEELAFRGFLTRRLIGPDFTRVPPGTFTWTSFLVSSALFGGLHGRWLAGILAGLLFALALYRRRELADAVVAHMTSNALIAGYVLLGGAWSLWN